MVLKLMLQALLYIAGTLMLYGLCLMLKRMMCIWMGDRGRWQIINIWQGRHGNSWAIKHRDEYININPCFKVC